MWLGVNIQMFSGGYTCILQVWPIVIIKEFLSSDGRDTCQVSLQASLNCGVTGVQISAPSTHKVMIDLSRFWKGELHNGVKDYFN